ncbi:MAG: NAD(P)-binding domain-containing protein [Gemmatimonadales bacterium]|nr:NAD(P)-binding domain-containing protein [Gemmatimonadales bacterium]NIN12048.1 NAD(P)-binding domain-containing protein [Gemmatimonadales bacterium]NIR03283.1 NAD(P)-binding domain-containing protein [Gemmatimonadales bacterium]NIS66963.1 NAD(P)-binding domain-containing protein [Gemmatimonadales bacterium]
MKIAIIGTGNVGATLGKQWAAQHEIRFGTRDPGSSKVKDLLAAAEEIAGWAKGARVVKAFNTLGAQNFLNPRFGGQVANMFICGDDVAAKSTVGKLVEELGFDLVDAGPLTSARLLEPLAMLWIRLAYAEGLGPEIAFKLLRR